MRLMTRSDRRFCIVGAGACGLTAALRLAERGGDVVVIERESRPGGLAGGFQLDSGVWLERFYHHIFRSDRAAIRLIDELQLTDRLEWLRPSTVTLRAEKLHQLDSAPSLLRFSPIEPLSRLRMGAVLAQFRLLPNPRILEGRLAAATLRRLMGTQAYEAVWGPLLRGKFGQFAEEVTLPWFWARVHDRSAELGYLRGGFQQLYDGLSERVKRLGGQVLLDTSVVGIQGDPDGLEVQLRTPNGGETRRFDRVLSTLATPVTCGLATGLGEDYREAYGRVRSLGAHCLVLALDRQLTESYWINIADPGYPFLALVEHTNLVSAEDYGGLHLVYFGNYRTHDDSLFDMTPEEVLEAFAPSIRRINPAFDTSWVLSKWVFSAPNAQPVVDLRFRSSIPPFITPVPGLFSANLFQVYPHDRGQNYSILLGEQVSKLMQQA
jgi:protoporphyrinogen oxidase